MLPEIGNQKFFVIKLNTITEKMLLSGYRPKTKEAQNYQILIHYKIAPIDKYR